MASKLWKNTSVLNSEVLSKQFWLRDSEILYFFQMIFLLQRMNGTPGERNAVNPESKRLEYSVGFSYLPVTHLPRRSSTVSFAKGIPHFFIFTVSLLERKGERKRRLRVL